MRLSVHTIHLFTFKFITNAIQNISQTETPHTFSVSTITCSSKCAKIKVG